MKTSKFFLSTLIAAAAMSANAYAEDYTWDRAQDYSFTWDFSQANTQNGNTGVLGGTVTNTFATEEVTINEITKTVIKEGSSDGSYWEVNTNSFFYDSLQEVTSATEGTGTLTFSVDYYWTGAQWGENILHIGCNGTGVALGLSNGYISFATGTATDAEFGAAKTDLRLNANAWNTITWMLTGDLWSVSLNGGETVSGGEIANIAWNEDPAEVNKYSIGVKAPGWNSGATGLNDSGCKLANLSVAYTGAESLDLVWAGGADGGIWDGSTASWEGGSVFAYGDSVTFNTADATVTVSGTVAPGTVTISENTTFTGTDYKITPMDAVSVAAEKTLTLDGEGTLSVNSLAGSGNVEISSDSTLAITEVAGAQNETLDYSKVSGTGTLSLALNTENGQGVNASSLKGTLFVSGTGRLQLNATTLGDGAAVKFADGADMVLNGNMTEFSRNITLEGTSQLYFNSSSSDTVTFSGNVSGGTLVLENANTRTLNLSGEVALSGLSVSQNKTVNFTGETELSGLSINSNATVNVSGSTTLNGNADFDGTLKVLAGGTLTLSGHDALGYNNSGLDSGTLVLKGESSDSRASLIVNDTYNSSAASLTLSKTLEMQGYATISASEGCSLNSWHGTIVASGKDNKIVSPVKIRKELTVNVAEDGELSVVGSVSDGQAVVAGLVKTGDGKLTLEGDNSYGYGTTISEGTLVAAHQNALGGGDVSIATGAKLSLGAENVSVNNLSGSGLIDLAHGVANSILTINSTKDTEFEGMIAAEDDSGGISKGVSLLKNGNGVLTLSGGATLGSLRVAEGTLSINPRISADIVGVGSGANLKVTPVVDGLPIGAGAFNFESGAHLLVGLEYPIMPLDADNTSITFDLITATTIEFGGTTLDEGDSITLPEGYVVLEGDAFENYTKTWSYDGSTLSLTLAIPEPSLFGLLAGLGALTLVGTRRRRSKTA